MELSDKSVIEFSDYKSYLRARTGRQGRRTGLRAAMAKAANCHSTYVSQVLRGKADFSPEQAAKLNRLLGHTQVEADYFLLLVLKGRAGTSELRDYFEDKLGKLREARLNLKQRLGIGQGLSDEDRARYYSAWYYSAVHVCTSIPELQNREGLARYLGLSPQQLSECLDFLLRCGLIVKSDEGRWKIGPAHIHLGNESSQIIQHHTNWRVKAITSLADEKPSDLHYSCAVTLSREDSLRLKGRLIEVIDEFLKQIAKSPEEEACCFNLDFFRLKKVD